MKLISIILPTLHEVNLAKRLKEAIHQINLILPEHSFEWIIIDDSNEAQFQTLKTEMLGVSTDRHSLIIEPGNHLGKGAAVRKGVFLASGSVIFYQDADFTTDVRYLLPFVSLIESNLADIVIAERPSVRSFRRPIRAILSLGLFFLVKFLFFQKFRFMDTQCGFKGFRSSILKSLASKQTIDGGMFDVELLFYAVRAKYKIKAITVERLPEIRPTRINILRSLCRDPIDLFTVRLKAFFCL